MTEQSATDYPKSNLPASSLNEVRAAFLDYFARNGHAMVASSPLVPRNDPTLMFTNAGMVQFKNVFTGHETRAYTSAASSQKCVRAGGKHNDLDNVGYTARHLTFFEMLGNFSFGDYFKAGAIELAWNLITREFELPASKLLVTVFADDDEAHGLWKKIAGLPDDRIIRIPTNDNFWSMGDTGPCGPCSEIFFDHGDKIAGGPPGSADADGDRFVEIWNLVFMQYDQQPGGARIALPRPMIDTGMGLERISAVLGGVRDVFSTDILRALIEAAAEITGGDPDGPHAASYRVIADHLRSSGFLIADGVMPSNEGRGYVLRRIMRRAMRHAQMLGAHEPVLWRLGRILVRHMGGHYQELTQAGALIEETLKLEEVRFRRTLDRGIKLLEDEVSKLPASANPAVLPGDVAFRLYDTYGFPLDLTQDALRDRGVAVDTAGFETAMARQKAEARASWSGSGEAATESIWFSVRERSGATEFLGYESESAEALIIAILADGRELPSAPAGAEVQIVLNQTPFYAESGGQLGDTGVLGSAKGAGFIVTNTQKRLGDIHAHIGTVTRETIHVGDSVTAEVDPQRRSTIRANHSATHLLHAALRNVLGNHVTQKGSSVGPDRLRFDFSHPKPLSLDEISEVEQQVNSVIRQNSAVTTHLMSPDDAVTHGAMALFGEKYGDEVRVLTMGQAGESGSAFSIELCGGTHVKRSGDIALLHIISESAVASGVRRIEALTGEAAWRYLDTRDRQMREAAQALRTTPDELTGRLTVMLQERKKLENELAGARKKLAISGASDSSATGQSPSAPELCGGVHLLARRIDGINPKDLRALVDSSKKTLGSGVAVFIAVNEGKGAISAGITDDLTARLSAVDLVQIGAREMGGSGGGGRPDMAQAGGPDGEKAEAAINAIRQFLIDSAVG